MEIHPAAHIFPLDEEHIGELASDIKAHGQQVPIEMMDNRILDGRRRYLACLKAGVEPKYREVNPPDPTAYVVSINLHRRHLTPGQLSMCAARARSIYDEQAKERQRDAGKNHGRGKVMENLPEPIGTTARDQVGKVFGVSGKSVDHAGKVLAKGVAELVKAVDEGRMAVSTAAILASESEDVQRKEIEELPNRKYQSVSKRTVERTTETVEEVDEGKVKGVGVIRANEAINCLTRIPKNDALRKRGFQLVMDWVKHNL